MEHTCQNSFPPPPPLILLSTFVLNKMSPNFITLFKNTSNELAAAKFLQENGIIHQERVCECGSEMKKDKKTSHDKQIPIWRCTKTTCRARKGLRIDTWLDASKLPLDTIVHFMYWWSREITSIVFSERELGINHDSTVDWSNFMREVCAHFLLRKQSGKKIGGPNCIVEIDESQFYKRKNNVGRVFPPQWVFGGICRETREVFIAAVPNRSAETLLAIVRDRIAEGSIIMSDCWSAYNMLGADGTYEHMRVNHSCNFVDPVSGAHTQTIERTWRSAKARNKKQHGTHRQMLESYLCEFFWREDVKNRGADPFEDILAQIVAFMPPK